MCICMITNRYTTLHVWRLKVGDSLEESVFFCVGSSSESEVLRPGGKHLHLPRHLLLLAQEPMVLFCLLFFKHLVSVCVCVCIYSIAMAHVWRSENNL